MRSFVTARGAGAVFHEKQGSGYRYWQQRIPKKRKPRLKQQIETTLFVGSLVGWFK
jgi:hypothetical protein